MNKIMRPRGNGKCERSVVRHRAEAFRVWHYSRDHAEFIGATSNEVKLAVSYGLERTITDLDNAAACLVGALLGRRLLSLRCAQSDQYKHGLSISIRRRPDWECQHRRRMRNSVGSCRYAQNSLALLRCRVHPGCRIVRVVDAFQRTPPLKSTRSRAQADRERVYRNLSDYCRIHPVPGFFQPRRRKVL